MEDDPFMDFRRHAPATARNREPILAVLADVLPDSGTVLEVASGTGEHATWFANALAPRPWLPSASSSRPTIRLAMISLTTVDSFTGGVPSCSADR